VSQEYPTTGMPPMIGKMLSIPEWLDYIANYQFSALKPTKVVLHHTWVPTIEQWHGLTSMKNMQTYYGNKGWTSAPHAYIGPDGIWLFTPLRDIGIHANAGNGSRAAGWYSIGIEMVGNYDNARPSGAIWDAAKAMMGGISRKLGIAPRNLISFHREYNTAKSCPGWAVTKDWVFAEVEGWLANHTGGGASVPTGVIGSPTPDVEHLGELILDQSFGRRAEGYNEAWAFHLFAVQNNLGFPTAKSQMLTAEGKTINYQPFARDTLYCEVPNWGDVHRLSELLAGSIPPAGTLGRALLDATYQTGGAVFHPEWAFHQYAMAGASLGPPLAESKTVAANGVTYSYQVYATDTIYSPGTDWSNIKRLSALASSSNAADVSLRNVLVGKTYETAGMQYHPEWAFHQMAFQLGLGAPLGKADPVSMGTSQYNFQVYATDTLYNVIPNWSDVKQLSSLIKTGPRRAVLAADDAPAVRRAVLSADVVYDPQLKEHYIVRYSVPGIGATAAGSRSGAKIAAIVLHGDSGPAEEVLARMAAPGAKMLTHYYIAADSQIYQLVSDKLAARHAGMATWQGRRRNINRISLGIAIERPRRGFTSKQIAALKDLVSTLRSTYNIPSTAILRWGDLASGKGGDLSGLPNEF